MERNRKKKLIHALSHTQTQTRAQTNTEQTVDEEEKTKYKTNIYDFVQRQLGSVGRLKIFRTESVRPDTNKLCLCANTIRWLWM